MQTLVVYRKSDNRVIAAFRYDTLLPDANVLMLPGYAYLITTKEIDFYQDHEGKYCVRVGTTK